MNQGDCATEKSAMHQLAFEDEGHRLEAAMRMRAERQAAIVWWINLRAVMVEEKEWVDLLHAWARHRAARDEICNVIAMGCVDGADGF